MILRLFLKPLLATKNYDKKSVLQPIDREFQGLHFGILALDATHVLNFVLMKYTFYS